MYPLLLKLWLIIYSNESGNFFNQDMRPSKQQDLLLKCEKKKYNE